MPTGYTSVIYEGKDITRNEFIMRCSRAFGALIMMRDLPLDAPIPERFEPDTYAKESLEQSKLNLDYYKSLKVADAQTEMEHEHQTAIEKYEKNIQRENELMQRLQKLIDDVESWNPPSKDHAELKRFCIKQLQDSIENDCKYSKHQQKPVLQNVEMWRNEKIAFAIREIKYYEEDWQEEVERTENRNTWIKLLKESL